STIIHCLDPDSILGVGNRTALNNHSVDDIIRTASDAADGQTVAAAACATHEVDIGAGVDGETVVLILDVRVGDGDAGRGANVKSVGVVAAVSNVTCRVVDGDVVKDEVG